MKHNIRKTVYSWNGEMRRVVKEIDCELGSGRFDKNGREIFEGDKVNVKEVGRKRQFDGKIVFDDGCFCFLRSPIQTWFDDGYSFEIVDD